MSIRHSLMALLKQGPRHGYQLRAEFEARTGGTWPLNVGQVYTTLQRLQRDGLVDVAGEADVDGRIAYQLTAAGRLDVDAWFVSPVDKSGDPRDELSIKLALSVGMEGVDVPGIIQTQRAATLRQLQDYTRLKRQADDTHDLAWELVLERLIFSAESQVRWLDHVEARVRRERPQVMADSDTQSADHIDAAQVDA